MSGCAPLGEPGFRLHLRLIAQLDDAELLLIVGQIERGARRRSSSSCRVSMRALPSKSNELPARLKVKVADVAVSGCCPSAAAPVTRASAKQREDPGVSFIAATRAAARHPAARERDGTGHRQPSLRLRVGRFSAFTLHALRRLHADVALEHELRRLVDISQGAARFGIVGDHERAVLESSFAPCPEWFGHRRAAETPPTRSSVPFRRHREISPASQRQPAPTASGRPPFADRLDPGGRSWPSGEVQPGGRAEAGERDADARGALPPHAGTSGTRMSATVSSVTRSPRYSFSLREYASSSPNRLAARYSAARRPARPSPEMSARTA